MTIRCATLMRMIFYNTIHHDRIVFCSSADTDLGECELQETAPSIYRCTGRPSRVSSTHVIIIVTCFRPTSGFNEAYHFGEGKHGTYPSQLWEDGIILRIQITGRNHDQPSHPDGFLAAQEEESRRNRRHVETKSRKKTRSSNKLSFLDARQVPLWDRKILRYVNFRIQKGAIIITL
jgi:hypothetical protein